MFDAVLGLAASVPVVFANGRLIEFAAMYTLAQGPTPTPTGPELNTNPGTIPTNQENQLNLNPKSGCGATI